MKEPARATALDLGLGLVMLLVAAVSAVNIYTQLPHRPQVSFPSDAAGVFELVFAAVAGGAYLGRYLALRGRS